MKKIMLIFLFILMLMKPVMSTDFPEIKGWKTISETMTYIPENLYEYINGAADQFLDYGFQMLSSRDFAKDDLKVTIDIYDMGSQINAYGIYKIERPIDNDGLKIGAEAIISPPYQCLLLKGSYYIKVNAFDGEITESNGKELLESIAKAIPGEVEFPDVLNLLPSQNKIPGSEGYTRVAFIGLAELNHCIHAKYSDQNDKKFQYFIVLPIEGKTKDSVWQELTKKWKTLEHENYSILVKNVPYKGLNAVALVDEKIIGVTNCENENQALERLEVFWSK